MKTFQLNSERSSVDGIRGELNPQSSINAAPFRNNDIKTLTHYAPIMLSDDDSQITRLYEVLMARVGLSTVSVPEGHKALDYMLHNPVSLVISNQMKPHVTGMEMLSTLRRDPSTTNVPFIMITATPDYESRQTFKTLGGDAYLTKPIDSRQLTQTVTQLLSAQLSKQLMT